MGLALVLGEGVDCILNSMRWQGLVKLQSLLGEEA